MAIYRLLQNSAFEPEAVTRMAAAYEDALRVLGLISRTDPLTETIAKKIIEIAQTGERDVIRLRNGAIESLTSTAHAKTKARDYRLYIMTETNHVAKPPTIISCNSDQDAIAQARQLLGPCDIEIWDGARTVIRLGKLDTNDATPEPGLRDS